MRQFGLSGLTYFAIFLCGVMGRMILVSDLSFQGKTLLFSLLILISFMCFANDQDEVQKENLKK